MCLGRLKQRKWCLVLFCSLAAVNWQSELMCTTLHPRKYRRPDPVLNLPSLLHRSPTLCGGVHRPPTLYDACLNFSSTYPHHCVVHDSACAQPVLFAAQVAHFVWCMMLSKNPNPAATAAAAAAVITLAAVTAGGEEASEEEEEEVEQEDEAELVLGVLEEEEEQMEEVGQAM